MAFEQEKLLKDLVVNCDTFNQLLPLVKIKELEAFAANEMIKLLVAAGDEGKDENLVKMIQECLNFVSSFSGRESDDEFSPLMTTLHVIEEATQLSTSVCKALERSGLFPALLTLMTLQITKYPDRKLALTNECLLIIYFSNITDFERLMGYGQLKAILVSFADVFFQEKTEIVDRLFELALRTRREVFWGAKVFTQNPRFIMLIIELLPVMGMTTIVYTLSRLYTIFQSLPNVAACSGAGLTRILLGILEGACIPESSPIFTDTAVLARLIEVIQLLATYSLSASDLKRIIRLLSRTSPDGKARLNTFPYLVKCLRKTSIEEVGPSAYYNFDGRSSQFILPPFEQWPFSQGGTLFTWLRIESLSRKKAIRSSELTVKTGIEVPSPAGAYQLDSSYKPRILSFMSEDQSEGMEVFIENGTLHLGVTTAGQTEVIKCTPEKYVLPEKRWIALGLAFSQSLIVPTNGELRVFIDGAILFKIPFTYPKNLVSAKYNSVGCVSVPNADLQSFNGQIGTIFFFDHPIDIYQASSLFVDGPKFLGSLKSE